MATTISGSSGVTFPAGGVGNPAGAVVGTTDTQTLTNKTLGAGLVAGASYLTSGTVNAGGTNPFPVSSGPTNVDFTGIPSWVKRITVMFTGVSTNATGSSPFLLQIGSGSTTTTGYISYSGGVNNVNQTFTANSTAGFLLTTNMGNASTINGHAIITLVSSNTWVCSSVFGGLDGSSANLIRSGGGYSPNLSGTLDRIRITTVGGTDQFDAGSINILYE